MCGEWTWRATPLANGSRRGTPTATELTELVDFGGDVLQAGRQAMDARGAEVSSELFFVWTFRDGRAVRMRMFYHRDQALRAIGA